MSDHAFCKTCHRVVRKEHIHTDGNCSEHTVVNIAIAPKPAPAQPPVAPTAPDEGETD